MARITYQFFPEAIDGDLDIDEGLLTTGTGKRAVFTDFTSGDKIIFEGKGLSYEQGTMTGGTLQSLTLVTEDGVKFLSIRDFEVDARFLAGDNVREQVDSFSKTLAESDLRVVGINGADELNSLNGDDLLLARRGDDLLNGSYGNDILVGGTGNDTFVFMEGRGNDVIKDFDANGGIGRQDHIDADFDAIESITQSGKNTLIDFGDGDILTLANIKAAQIDQTDFV